MGDKYGGYINWSMRQLLVLVHNPETVRKVRIFWAENKKANYFQMYSLRDWTVFILLFHYRYIYGFLMQIH